MCCYEENQVRLQRLMIDECLNEDTEESVEYGDDEEGEEEDALQVWDTDSESEEDRYIW